MAADHRGVTTKHMADLGPYLKPDQKAGVQRMAELLSVSEGAAVALSLCREAIRDYCPPAESYKVVAALLRLEIQDKP
jgi:hypothetical protein